MLLACRNRNIQAAISCPHRREAFRKLLFKGSLPEMDQDQERLTWRVKATGGVPGGAEHSAAPLPFYQT